MATWRRNTFVTANISGSFNWEDAISAGNSYIRCHIRWGFYLDCPVTTDFAGVAANIVTLGLVTTVGNGSESRPNARTQAADQAPPTQRWIYWETRSPVMTALDEAAGVASWRDSGATEPSDTKGQVLATGIPAGDSLNLSTSWAAAGDFDSAVNAVLWVSLSILKKL